MLTSIGKYLLTKLATEAFIKRVCLATAKHLASKSSSVLDDELLNLLSKSLNK